ncbi:hypothetical protein [Stutzerimonas xanthomarina]
MQIDQETRVDKAITLLGSGLALVALFTLCSIAPEALLAITH